MKVALPIWNDRISPVFDVARTLLVVEVDRGVETSRLTHPIRQEPAEERTEEVLRRGADVLICGGITQSLLNRLMAHGVRVISGVRGGVDEVLTAFLDGRLHEPDVTAPPRARPGESP